jgi:hypothetical protein
MTRGVPSASARTVFELHAFLSHSPAIERDAGRQCIARFQVEVCRKSADQSGSLTLIKKCPAAIIIHAAVPSLHADAILTISVQMIRYHVALRRHRSRGFNNGRRDRIVFGKLGAPSSSHAQARGPRVAT